MEKEPFSEVTEANYIPPIKVTAYNGKEEYLFNYHSEFVMFDDVDLAKDYATKFLSEFAVVELYSRASGARHVEVKGK